MNTNNKLKSINQLKIYIYFHFDIIPKLAINFISRRTQMHSQTNKQQQKNYDSLESAYIYIPVSLLVHCILHVCTLHIQKTPKRLNALNCSNEIETKQRHEGVKPVKEEL